MIKYMLYINLTFEISYKIRSGWSGNMKGYKGEQMSIRVDQQKTRVDLNSLAICKEIAKIDVEKLGQREVSVDHS